MKGKTRNKLLAIVAVVILAAVTVLPGIGALKTRAAGFTYPAVELSSHPSLSASKLSLTKVLALTEDVAIPAEGFGFAFDIDPISDVIPATSTTLKVLPGPTATSGQVTYPVIESAVFASGTAEDASPYSTEYTKSYTAVKDIDFSGVKFTEPGIYRYKIHEKSDGHANTGVGYDAKPYIILDIYVEDVSTTSEKKIQVTAYTMIKSDTDSVAAPSSQNDLTSGKSESTFVNTYPTNTLTIKKTVDGNQGSKDEYFKFNIKLEGDDTVNPAVIIEDSRKFAITGLDTGDDISANNATSYPVATMRGANGVTELTGDQLKTGYDVYLQHGDTVTLSGLVPGCKFTITETNNEYNVATVVKQVVSGTETTVADADNVDDNATVQGTISNNTTVSYTNTKTGLIPTGVVLSVVPWVIAGVVIIGGVVFFAVRSKKKYDEQ